MVYLGVDRRNEVENGQSDRMDKRKSKYSAVPTREVVCAPVYRGKGRKRGVGMEGEGS